MKRKYNKQAIADRKKLLMLSDRTWYRGGRKSKRALLRFRQAIKIKV